MPLTYGSVCSGIEAATVAWEPLGWKPAWFAEIEPFASAVLAHHYPHVANLGDMTKIAMLVRAGLVDAPDVLVGGTPCQAFSVAGLRGGLIDPRGQLTLAYADLANAIDEKRPGDECVIYWENVPGVLSSKDNAFGCFLGLLAGEDSELEPDAKPVPGKSSQFWKWNKDEQSHTCRWPNVGCVYGPQRAIAWRILDAQYFGVAQRRRRVFVVASARKGFDPAKLLFESDGVRRDIAPSRETGQDVTGTLASRTSGGGFPGTDEACDGFVVAAPVQRSVERPRGDGLDTLIAVSNAEGATGLPFLTVSNIGKYVNNQTPLVYAHGEIMPTMRAGAPNGSAAHGQRSGDTRNDYIIPVCVTGNVTHTLKAEGFDASEDGTGRGQPIICFTDTRGDNRGSGIQVTGAIANTLHCAKGQSEQQSVAQGMAVRRLTPRECERLQGFPDDYTLVPIKGKPAADGPRYKALGNSMARPCMEWLGMRLIVTHPEMFIS